MTHLDIGETNFDPSEVILVIEEGIKVEKLILEANKILKNDNAVLILEHRITEAQILLNLLRFKM